MILVVNDLGASGARCSVGGWIATDPLRLLFITARRAFRKNVATRRQKPASGLGTKTPPEKTAILTGGDLFFAC